MSEQQRKANITIEQLQTEGEDLRARLEVCVGDLTGMTHA